MDWQDKWVADKAFWQHRGVATYDCEYTGSDNYREMVQQNYGPLDTYWGDWVRSEDYRRDVEKLEARIKELEAEKKSLTLPSP